MAKVNFIVLLDKSKSVMHRCHLINWKIIKPIVSNQILFRQRLTSFISFCEWMEWMTKCQGEDSVELSKSTSTLSTTNRQWHPRLTLRPFNASHRPNFPTSTNNNSSSSMFVCDAVHGVCYQVVAVAVMARGYNKKIGTLQSIFQLFRNLVSYESSTAAACCASRWSRWANC